MFSYLAQQFFSATFIGRDPNKRLIKAVTMEPGIFDRDRRIGCILASTEKGIGVNCSDGSESIG
jgi:hypothetical protein